MPHTTLENIFRYYCLITVFGICLNSIYPDSLTQFRSFFGNGVEAVTILLIAGWVTGALFYFLYRALIYDWIICPLLDVVSYYVLQKDTYRS